MRRPGSRAVGAAAALGVVGVALTAALDTRDLAFTLGVRSIQVAARLAPGQTACQRDVAPSAEFAGVRLQIGTYHRPGQRLDVAIVRDGRQVGHGTIPPGYPDVTVQEARFAPVAAGGRVDVCVTNRDRTRVALYGGPGDYAVHSQLTVAGRRRDADVDMVFVRPESSSALALTPTMLRRAAMWHPAWVGPWTFWLLALVAALGVPLLLARAVTAAEDESDVSAELPPPRARRVELWHESPEAGRGESAIAVHDVAKSFELPHEHYHTLKERALHPFRSRTYDTLRAVEGVSFDVAPGEFFGIVGRNGSGKSTLLKCLAGIYDIDRGEIAIRGRLSPFIELGVGFNPDLSARDNVVINAIMLGLPRKEAERRFDEIIAFAGLEEFVDLKLKNYSSGMHVRLAFSVAIQVDADVLLIDEVLAVGDAAFQRKCFQEFERMKAAGRTIVFVTHDMSAIERFCDRAMLIERGQVLNIGAPAEIARMYNEVNFGEIAVDGRPGRPDAGEIVAAWFEDEDGTRITELAQGRRCRAFVEIKAIERLEAAELRFIFRNDVRHTIMVAGTAWDDMQLGPLAPGESAIVEMSFDNWLAPSRYTLTAALRRAGAEEALDIREDLVTLLVPGYHKGGVADIPHEFKVRRS